MEEEKKEVVTTQEQKLEINLPWYYSIDFLQIFRIKGKGWVPYLQMSGINKSRMFKARKFGSDETCIVNRDNSISLARYDKYPMQKLMDVIYDNTEHWSKEELENELRLKIEDLPSHVVRDVKKLYEALKPLYDGLVLENVSELNDK